MQRLIQYIRKLFCPHEFEHLDTIKYFNGDSERPSKIVHAYRCKHCGFVQKIKL